MEPTVQTSTTDMTPCAFNVITNSDPVAFSVRRSGLSVPASICVQVDSTQVRVTVTGEQSVVIFTPDP